MIDDDDETKQGQSSAAVSSWGERKPGGENFWSGRIQRKPTAAT